jgi:lipid-A-disaccharide synthase
VKTVLLSAGDLSGERHCAELVRALRGRLPELRFVGMGGASMAAAGVELYVDQRQLAVGGIFEILASLPRVIRTWRKMLRCVRETRPDVIVLVDSGGFNLAFARRVRAISSAPILYYVAPQVWVWRPGRLRRLAARTDRIAVILPFEPAFYADHGIAVDYVGHPAVDAFEAGTTTASVREAARARLGIEANKLVLGLFPGSRRNELARHLPIQLKAFARLRASLPDSIELEGIVGLAPSLDRDEALAIAAADLVAAPEALRFVSAEDGSLLDACDVALVKPGTITVELMLRRTPMVVMGRVHPATAIIARHALKIDWLAMPNLIANEEIVPEFMQEAATEDRIAAALAPLFGGAARDRQIEALTRASDRLGPAGASKRVAAIVEELLGTASA